MKAVGILFLILIVIGASVGLTFWLSEQGILAITGEQGPQGEQGSPRGAIVEIRAPAGEYAFDFGEAEDDGWFWGRQVSKSITLTLRETTGQGARIDRVTWSLYDCEGRLLGGRTKSYSPPRHIGTEDTPMNFTVIINESAAYAIDAGDGEEDDEGTGTIEFTVSGTSADGEQPIVGVIPGYLQIRVSVTPSESEAQNTEYNNIVAAVSAMMEDNKLTSIPNPVTGAANRTRDMTAFPDATSNDTVPGGKTNDPNGNAYNVAAGDKAGYILYGHDIIGDSATTGLVNYVTFAQSEYWYTIDSDGTVHQYDADGNEIVH